jgi:hypothetical protein
MSLLLTAGGRIQCLQCSAQSKRTHQQCKAPACRGKTKCRFHGGKSTGPRTAEGRARCAAVRTVHGRETQAIRKERRHTVAQLALLEKIGFALGMLKGTRTRGRKPALMNEAYPELQEILRHISRIVRPK